MSQGLPRWHQSSPWFGQTTCLLSLAFSRENSLLDTLYGILSTILLHSSLCQGGDRMGFYHKMVAVVWGGSRNEADFQVFEFHKPGWKEGEILSHHVWVGTPGKKEDELPPRVKDTCYCFASCECGSVRADCRCDPGVRCAIGCATPSGWVTCESHCTG